MQRGSSSRGRIIVAGEPASHAKRSLEAVKRLSWVDYEDMSGISKELLRPVSIQFSRDSPMPSNRYGSACTHVCMRALAVELIMSIYWASRLVKREFSRTVVDSMLWRLLDRIWM